MIEITKEMIQDAVNQFVNKKIEETSPKVLKAYREELVDTIYQTLSYIKASYTIDQLEKSVVSFIKNWHSEEKSDWGYSKSSKFVLINVPVLVPIEVMSMLAFIPLNIIVSLFSSLSGLSVVQIITNFFSERGIDYKSVRDKVQNNSTVPNNLFGRFIKLDDYK